MDAGETIQLIVAEHCLDRGTLTTQSAISLCMVWILKLCGGRWLGVQDERMMGLWERICRVQESSIDLVRPPSWQQHSLSILPKWLIIFHRRIYDLPLIPGTAVLKKN